MPITLNYVDPVAGSDLAAGTLVAPWQTLQWAFDHCVRNTVDGNQICLKSSGPHVNAAALDLATFIAAGALSLAAPLIVRGYTAAANDGGIGEIDCNGATMWAAATYDHMYLVELNVHNFGNNHGINLDDYITLFRCQVSKGASSPNAKYLVNLSQYCQVVGCYIHDPGDGSGGCLITSAAPNHVIGNYIDCGTGTSARSIYGTSGMIESNIVKLGQTGQVGPWVAASDTASHVCGNIVYNSTAGTVQGIIAGNTTVGRIQNNIIVGFSGVGGIGISAPNVGIIGHNAFYNNTAQTMVTDQKFLDLTANDVTLAANPFVNAAGGDFSLTAAAQAALRDVGWPAAYLGAHANTDGHITIGPIQYGAAVAAGVTRGRILYGIW